MPRSTTTSRFTTKLAPCLLALAACAGPGEADDEVEGESETSSETGEGELAAWTIFVYGHADHNLSPSLVADIQEMNRAIGSDEINVIVMADFNGSTEGFTSGIEWYRIVGDGADPEVIEMAPEANLDDPAVLSAAIERAFTDYPAARHGLILWDHGGAWLGGFGGDTADGSTTGPGILPAPLAAAIGAGLDAAGTELEFLSFDTCLMNGTELLAELAPLAEVYIANAEIDYGAGWDYEQSLGWLAEHPDADVHEFAAAEVQHWDAHHASMGVSDGLLRAHAAIDTSAWAEFGTAYALFVDQLLAGGEALEFGRAMSATVPGYFASDVGSLSNSPVLRDVGQFLAVMAASDTPTVADAAATAQDALSAMIVGSSMGELRSAQSGVHIHLPLASRVAELAALYDTNAAAWIATTHWDAGLEALAAGSDTVAPLVTTDVESVPGTLLLSSDDDDVAAAEIFVAAPSASDPDLIEVLGLVGMGEVEPGVEHGFVWGNELLTLSDGGEAQYVAVLPFAQVGDIDETILAIPGTLTVEGESYEAMLPFGASDLSTNIVIMTTGESSTATVAFSELPPGATFVPIVPSIRISTGEFEAAQGPALSLAGDLVFAVMPAPPGDYAMITSVQDVWGNAEPVVDAVSVP